MFTCSLRLDMQGGFYTNEFPALYGRVAQKTAKIGDEQEVRRGQV
jgi:hypothetical protein